MEKVFREGEQVKTFTVWNHKGGVAKTTLTSLLSLYLSETSRKVLMIDLDSQESLTSGFLEENETRKTVYDWLVICLFFQEVF